MSSASPLAKDRSHRGPIAHEMACGCSKIAVFLLKNVQPPVRLVVSTPLYIIFSNRVVGYYFIALRKLRFGFYSHGD